MSANSRRRTRLVVTVAVLAADLLALAAAATMYAWTRIELETNPEADALTAIGYVIAGIVAAPAVASLPFLGLARCWWGRRAGDVLLGIAAVPPALMTLLLVGSRLA